MGVSNAAVISLAIANAAKDNRDNKAIFLLGSAAHLKALIRFPGHTSGKARR